MRTHLITILQRFNRTRTFKFLSIGFIFSVATMPGYISNANEWTLTQPEQIQPGQVRTTDDASYTFNPGGRLTGGDRGGMMKSCGLVEIGIPCRAVKVSDKFADFMSKNIPYCTAKALQAQGLGSNFSKIKIRHMGTYANRDARGKRSISMHATGRAIDLSQMDITLANGRQFKIDMTIGSRNKPFYNAFISCWRAQNAARPGCRRSGLNGAIDCKNPLHHNHVHLSMPFCPKQPGIITN
jgi:hypothetical protein